MHAIISKLDSTSTKTVVSLWEKLYVTCGLTSIYDIPTPHVTWFVAEEINLEKAEPSLQQVSEQSEPFKLHTFGVGIFTGESPVLYLPMVKSLEMIDLHCKIWKHISPYSKERKSYYLPKFWVPHITLALRDLNRENLDCAVNAICFEPIELYITIDNLVTAEYEESKPARILTQYQFNA